MKIQSLRFKIMSLFILLMVINAGFVTLILYHSLKNELVSRDDNLLVNRADQLAKLIVSGIDIKSLPIYFQRMMDVRQDVIKITDAENTIIVDTNPEIIPENQYSPVSPEDLSLQSISHQNTADGIPLSSVNFEIQSATGKLHVTIAKLSVDRNSVLTGYLQKSIAISAIAIIFMVILSLWLIRRGLQDITRLSQITAKTGVHSLGKLVDISTLPDELKSLGDSLNIMRSRLKYDFTRLTQLADDLAHELRTPIHAIKVQNEITLQKSRTADEYKAIIISNTEELDKLAQIIRSVLFIARAENKNINLKQESVSVTELMDDVYELLSPYAEENGSTLVNEISDVSVSADRMLLMRALINIVSNAIKYAHVNTTIISRAVIRDSNILISVMNEGDVIENSDDVFTRFWRGDNARTSEGSGLGLSIVQAIMKLHTGEVRFERIESRNVVTLVLPVKIV